MNKKYPSIILSVVMGVAFGVALTYAFNVFATSSLSATGLVSDWGAVFNNAGSSKVIIDNSGNVSVGGTLNGSSASHGKQRFTANGTFTVPTGVTKVWVSMSGGGGGGGGDGEGGVGAGGGGAHSIIAQEVAVTSGSNVTVTIGTGGTAGTSNTSCGGSGGSGTAGGTSSFGSYVSAAGGGGGGGGSTTGCGSYSGSGGVGGTPGGTGGGYGGSHYGTNNSIPSEYGGGNSIFGNGGLYLKNGNGYGGGGGSRASGAPGFVLVEW